MFDCILDNLTVQFMQESRFVAYEEEKISRCLKYET